MLVKVTHVTQSKSTRAYLKLKLHGTTFSGHPLATSLFGTLRNVMYYMFAYWRKHKTNNI